MKGVVVVVVDDMVVVDEVVVVEVKLVVPGMPLMPTTSKQFMWMFAHISWATEKHICLTMSLK